MAKPRSKAESRWLTEFWELAFVRSGRQRKRHVKRMRSRACRQAVDAEVEILDPDAFDALACRLSRAPRVDQALARVLSRRAPWD